MEKNSSSGSLHSLYLVQCLYILFSPVYVVSTLMNEHELFLDLFEVGLVATLLGKSCSLGAVS